MTQNLAELCLQLIGLEGQTVHVVTLEGHERTFRVERSEGPAPTHLEVGDFFGSPRIANRKGYLRVWQWPEDRK